MALSSSKSLFTIFLSLCCFLSVINAACVVPDIYWGDWYTMEGGIERNVLINNNEMSHETYSGSCHETVMKNGTEDAEGNFDSLVLFHNVQTGCIICWEIIYRTPNILQYRESSIPCNGEPSMSLCDEINIGQGTDKLTLFKKSLEKVNCKASFEGIYHFTYEISAGGGGICDDRDSFIIACQLPGSQYIDNEVFKMDYGTCPHVVFDATDDEVFFTSDHRFQCMGTWEEDNGNIFTAIADLGRETPERRFRCMLTRDDQQLSNNLQRWTMSRRPACGSLQSSYEGDIRLVMEPALLADQEKSVYGSQLVEPTCNLPLNFTGTWFTSGEFDTDVTINTTHVYFKTKIDQYTYRETYFTCQQNRDTRYLMTAVTVGKCEVDYLCFDFEPRHHNIIRWRMGKPYRLVPGEKNQPLFLERKFRQACVWSSFTIDRTKTAWKYNVFLLNPPAPVECPIGGRYRFEQTGDEGEKFSTRVRGITERPRHKIGCRKNVTEIKSCATNQKKLLVDADYCDTVDHTGRPIGEYEEPDRELNCIGFWMEDMTSYMVTYDEEDAVSKFRCWVYERLDWRDFIMSRSTRAVCGRHQTARSFRPSEGASLSMVLKESERLWDDCPQRYLDGSDPYASETKIYVLGSATHCSLSLLVTSCTLLLTMILT